MKYIGWWLIIIERLIIVIYFCEKQENKKVLVSLTVFAFHIIHKQLINTVYIFTSLYKYAQRVVWAYRKKTAHNRLCICNREEWRWLLSLISFHLKHKWQCPDIQKFLPPRSISSTSRLHHCWTERAENVTEKDVWRQLGLWHFCFRWIKSSVILHSLPKDTETYHWHVDKRWITNCAKVYICRHQMCQCLHVQVKPLCQCLHL